MPPGSQQFLDTIRLPGWDGVGPYPNVTLRMPFEGLIEGVSVYHCHIIEHEDKGMMASFVIARGDDDDDSGDGAGASAGSGKASLLAPAAIGAAACAAGQTRRASNNRECFMTLRSKTSRRGSRWLPLAACALVLTTPWMAEVPLQTRQGKLCRVATPLSRTLLYHGVHESQAERVAPLEQALRAMRDRGEIQQAWTAYEREIAAQNTKLEAQPGRSLTLTPATPGSAPAQPPR